MQIPKDVQEILQSLTFEGHEAVIVGGCVRDSLMGLAPKDWDIATSAQPDEVKKVFRHTVDTGIEHGTVSVIINQQAYEVTTYRIDGLYKDGRRPTEVTFTTDLEEDLSRRDFTMNAIAYSPVVGLVDPFNGVNDIKNKNIRCVGHAPSRFTEDALRMMRAIRFAAQLSFSIDPETYAAIAPLANRIQMVSVERIREELTKTLASPNPGVLPLLEETGLWFFPKLELERAVPWLTMCPKEPAMLYALLYADEKFMRQLKFDNHCIKETDTYTRWLTKYIPNSNYNIKVALNEMGAEQFQKLLILKNIIEPNEHWNKVRASCERILLSNECYTLKDLAVNGQDLIEIGIAPGENMGRIIAKLLDTVMKTADTNDKSALLEIACKFLD